MTTTSPRFRLSCLRQPISTSGHKTAMATDLRQVQGSNMLPISAGGSDRPSPQTPVNVSAKPQAQPSVLSQITKRPAATRTTTVMAIVTDTIPFESASAQQPPRQNVATKPSSSVSQILADPTIIPSQAGSSGSGLLPGTLTIAIAVPIILLAVLAPIIILTILTCHKKRRRRNRKSNLSVSKKLKLLDRPQDKLEYRPKGKYGPATWQRPLNSFSGFDFNFSRPRTVMSAISARSPRATTPRPTTPLPPIPTKPLPQNRPTSQRRPALSVLSRFANVDAVPDPPPPYVTRPMTLAHPYFRPSIPTEQITDTPRSARSVSPQLLVATPVEIQSLSGPYAPISQILSPPEQYGRVMTPSSPRRLSRSRFSEPSDHNPHTSASLQQPFSSPSPAPTNISGLSFDPSAWVASYERHSIVSSVDDDDDSRMDPHQIV